MRLRGGSRARASSAKEQLTCVQWSCSDKILTHEINEGAVAVNNVAIACTVFVFEGKAIVFEAVNGMGNLASS